MRKPTRGDILKLSQWIFIGLLAYAPLHIFISTIIGANLGGLALLKILKDIIALFGFCLTIGLSVREKWLRTWLKHPLVMAIVAYGLLTVLLALLKPTDQDAEILGVTYNLRFFIFFMYGWLLVKHFPAKPLLRQATKTVLASAGIVVTFGLIQYWFLPDNALTHLGFTKQNGVFPAFFIDDKPNLERVMSTVRDPNSLGSYLIIIASLLGAKFLATRRDRKLFWGGWLLATLLCLFLTFSRSALLGVVLAGLVLVGLRAKTQLASLRKCSGQLLLAGLIGVLLLGVGLYIARDSYLVQNVIFHADQSTVQENPNQLRLRFAKESVGTVVGNPVGLGPGTAGLASIKNQTQGTRLNENYYLQIATEVGILGLGLFILILAGVALQLLRLEQEDMVVALMAAGVGLLFTNLLVHIWSNEAVAYTWWGLIGLVVELPRKAGLSKS